ncbi:MAG TPA: DUF58 domain-containing protein [Bacilli bacterium]|nr:DUF58 domain-containing protein [Bacilli bacterium]
MKWLLTSIRPLLLFCLNGAVFAYAMFQGGFVSWFLFYGVLAISLVSFSVMAFPIRGVKVERIVERDILRAGETLQVTLQVRFAFWNPFAYLQIEEQLPKALQKFREKKKSAFYFFSWRRSLSFSYSLEAMPRGEHRFEKVTVFVGDMFGFFEKRISLSLPETVLVYPSFEPLEHWAVHSTRESGGSVPLSQSFEEELSLAGVRNYVPGDRLMSIDWKQTARHDRLMTKEFEAEHEQEAFLVFYQSEAPKHEAFERSIELAASFIDHFAKRKLPLGLAVAQHGDYVMPSAKQEHYGQLLHYFAKIQAPEVINAKSLSLAKRRQHSLYLFVTTSINGGITQEISELMSHKNHVVICFIQSEQTVAKRESEQIYAWRSQGIRVYCFTDERQFATLTKRG